MPGDSTYCHPLWSSLSPPRYCRCAHSVLIEQLLFTWYIYIYCFVGCVCSRNYRLPSELLSTIVSKLYTARVNCDYNVPFHNFTGIFCSVFIDFYVGCLSNTESPQPRFCVVTGDDCTKTSHVFTALVRVHLPRCFLFDTCRAVMPLRSEEQCFLFPNGLMMRLLPDARRELRLAKHGRDEVEERP